MTVLQYTKTLVELPPAARCGPYAASEFQSPADAQAWLDLKNSALKQQTSHGRDWSTADFQREVLGQPWFDPSCCWLTRSIRLSGYLPAIASLVLQLDHEDFAKIRWLLVAPDWRRRGVGSHLLALAERAAWRRGRRQVRLETLSSWQPACRFYEAHGYDSV